MGVFQLYLQFILAHEHGHPMKSKATWSLANGKCRSNCDGFYLSPNGTLKAQLPSQITDEPLSESCSSPAGKE